MGDFTIVQARDARGSASIGSCEEVVAALYIALGQKYVSQKDFDELYNQAHVLVAKINALIKSL